MPLHNKLATFAINLYTFHNNKRTVTRYEDQHHQFCVPVVKDKSLYTYMFVWAADYL